MLNIVAPKPGPNCKDRKYYQESNTPAYCSRHLPPWLESSAKTFIAVNTAKFINQYHLTMLRLERSYTKSLITLGTAKYG